MTDTYETEWPDNPVVAEVRAIRAKLWEEGGGTVAGFIDLIRHRAARNRTTEAHKTKPAKAQPQGRTRAK